MAERRKLVIVGDGYCGKTLMLTVFQNKEVLSAKLTPTVFETYIHTTTVDGISVDVELCDTAGQEGYDRLRLMAYKKADVVVLVYSISEPASFDNITHWKKELNSKLPMCPVILVGNKIDLRENLSIKEELKNKNREVVKTTEGLHMTRKIKAAEFFECSALHNVGVQEVFIAAIRATLKSKDDDGNRSSLWSNCVLS